MWCGRGLFLFYVLSLHDALPISRRYESICSRCCGCCGCCWWWVERSCVVCAGSRCEGGRAAPVLCECAAGRARTVHASSTCVGGVRVLETYCSGGDAQPRACGAAAGYFCSTFFPYTTLFRSPAGMRAFVVVVVVVVVVVGGGLSGVVWCVQGVDVRAVERHQFFASVPRVGRGRCMRHRRASEAFACSRRIAAGAMRNRVHVVRPRVISVLRSFPTRRSSDLPQV